MRDSNENMIELLDASCENNIYSSLIRHKIGDKVLKLRFSIVSSDYRRLRYILQFRPWENTGFAKYRYFFAHSFRLDHDFKSGLISVRVEQLDRDKQFEFIISKKYYENLLWFNSLKDTQLIKEMIEE
jgi:hypothetical protein